MIPAFLRPLLSRAASILARGPLAKAARHTIALATGWLVTQPVLDGSQATDQTSLWSVLVTLIVWAILIVWSLWSKTPPGATARQAVRAIAEAAASHIVPFIAGLAARHGYTGAEDSLLDLSEWAVLAAAGYVLSASARPDDPAPNSTAANSTTGGGVNLLPLLAILSLGILGLSGCAQVRGWTSQIADDYTIRACVEIPVGKLLHGDPDAQATVVDVQK